MCCVFFFFKQKTAYEMRISDWSSDVCSSDLTLEIHYRDKSIADVLDMTVEDGAEFFKAVPTIREKMETLQKVGLGYIKIGQSATTLSGGEAQRVKQLGRASGRERVCQYV